jgi:hypothetical protein
LKALLHCLKQWDKLASGPREAFFNSDFFENKALSTQFEKVNRKLHDARDEEDLIDLAACWLKSLSRILYVRENKFGAEVKKRAAKIPNLSERRLERSKSKQQRKD